MGARELGWHERCLKNTKSHLDRLHDEKERMDFRVRELEERVNFYQYQVDEAKKLGKDKFDDERFMVKKKS